MREPTILFSVGIVEVADTEEDTEEEDTERGVCIHLACTALDAAVLRLLLLAGRLGSIRLVMEDPYQSG